MIRMRETSNIDSQNLYKGKVFIVRNEPWEPYLSHAARIANSFSIDLFMECSSYDDSLISFPKSHEHPVVIWINWNRILNKEHYLNELGFLSNFANKVYLVLPNSMSDDSVKLKEQILQKLPWINLIEPSTEDETHKNLELGFSKNQILEIASYIGQNIAPYHFYPKVKAIITDLDNTLYSGVLGEDLEKNLRVSEDQGNLQKKLIGLYANGVLLNIVSKNNDLEVKSLFETADIISIPKNNFTCIVANWTSKSVGVDEILNQLNIDQESVVFLDDNPRELAEVALTFPRMMLIDASDSKRVNRILDLDLFSDYSSSSITSEQRSADIKANKLRRLHTDMTDNNDEVLKRINTKIQTKSAKLQKEFERAEELFKKTNQFNFSNRRTELNNFKESSTVQILLSSVSDIFSESGIISALMYSKIHGNVIEITEFVISCRALGRGIEKYIFKSMLDFLNSSKVADSKTEIRIHFIESSRNIPANHFLKEWFSEFDQSSLYKLNHSFTKQVVNVFGEQ